MVNLRFTKGTITDYMHGCNGQKGLPDGEGKENSLEVLVPGFFRRSCILKCLYC